LKSLSSVFEQHHTLFLLFIIVILLSSLAGQGQGQVSYPSQAIYLSQFYSVGGMADRVIISI